MTNVTFPELAANPWLLVLIFATLTLGSGRLTRVVVHDAYPPAIWWRMKWAEITNDGPWMKLFTCWWCLGPWVTLVAAGWFVLGMSILWIGVAWWIFWGWLALSYITSMIVARDEPAA